MTTQTTQTQPEYRDFWRFLGQTPRARRRALWGLALILPNTLGLAIFYGIPVLLSFGVSFTEWNLLRPPEFIGLGNFATLLQDPFFWTSLGNSFKLLLIAVPIEIALALGVALILNQRLPGRNILRAIYFLPVVTSTVAASVVWAWIFQPELGLLDAILTPLGIGGQKWLTDPNLVLIPIGVVFIWQRIGFDMILFLAGLQAVPRNLLDAATMDGASRWQRFRNVTLPMLSPITFLVIVLAIIQGFQIFDQVFVMTSRTILGGVGRSASTITFHMYRSGFIETRFGYASAVALALFLIILAITLVQLRLQRHWVYYESGEA